MLTEFMQYLVDQKFIEKAMPIEQLFAPIVEWSE
jgi:hypothetical protein